MTDFITPEVYGPLHFKYMFMGFAIWVIVPLIGKKLMNKKLQRITVLGKWQSQLRFVAHIIV